ncbi:hypothetical protein ACFUJT_29740 [Streptomyces griseoincarnatus]
MRGRAGGGGSGEEMRGEAREPREGRQGGKPRHHLGRQHGGLLQHGQGHGGEGHGGQGHGGEGRGDGAQLLGHATDHLPDGPQYVFERPLHGALLLHRALLPARLLRDRLHDRSHHALVRDTHRFTERQRDPLLPRPRTGLGPRPRRLLAGRHAPHDRRPRTPLTTRPRHPRLHRLRARLGHGLCNRPGVRTRAPLARRRLSRRATGAPGRILGRRPVALRREAVPHGPDGSDVDPHNASGGRAVRSLGLLPEQDAQNEHGPRHQRQPDRTPASRGAHHTHGGPGHGCC